VVLDLLDSLSRHLTELDVSSQRRLAEMKYKLLSTRVDPNDKKHIYELSSQALDTGTSWQNLFNSNNNNNNQRPCLWC